jgi:TolB-like protein
MKKLMMITVFAFLTAMAFAQAKPRLGVLPFTGVSDRDGDTIANIFANSKDLQQEFEIVMRTSSVNAALKEQQFQSLSGLTDSDKIAAVGKMMNAEYVVSGHVTPFRDIKLLIISIVDVKTMQQTAGDYEEYAEIEDIRALLPPMAANIIASVRAQNESHGPALAVLPLNIVDEEAVQQNDAEILAQILATEIANGHTYAVFPRTSTIETVMKEQDIQKSALTDPDTMIEIRKATNADFVLAGTVTKLGDDMNIFDVKILNVVSGALVKGFDRPYAKLSDGIDLMQQLAYDLTGVEPRRLAEAREEEDRKVAAAAKAAAKRIKAEKLKSEQYFGVGLHLGAGFGNDAGRDFNMFGNVDAAIPLVWWLFADIGGDIGFSGSIGGEDTHENATYRAYRLYARLNIGFPLKMGSRLLLLYAGGGYGYTKVSYAFAVEENWVEKAGMREHEYSGVDLAFGVILTGRHHGLRAGINLNNTGLTLGNLNPGTISNNAFFETQAVFGYTLRF